MKLINSWLLKAGTLGIFFWTCTFSAWACLEASKSIIPTTCYQGGIMVNHSGAQGNLSYYLLNSNGTDTIRDSIPFTSNPLVIDDLCAGDYKIIIVDDGASSECNSPGWPFSVTGPPCLDAAIDWCSIVVGGCEGPWTVRGIASGGVAPYRYCWKRGSQILSFGDVLHTSDSGIYTLTVTDTNDCDADVTIELKPLRIDSIVIKHLDCDSSASAELYYSGGIPDCECHPLVTLDTADFFSSILLLDGQTMDVLPSVDNNKIFTVYSSTGVVQAVKKPRNPIVWRDLPVGRMIMELGDESGGACKRSREIEILDHTNVPLSVQSTPICQNDDGTVSVNITGGSPPYSITWTHEGVYLPNADDQTTLTGLNDLGTYTATVTDSLGCTGTDSETLWRKIDAHYQLNTHGQPACSVMVSIDPIGGTAPFTIAWEDGHFGNNRVMALNGFHDYEVIVTDANGCTDTLLVELWPCGVFDKIDYDDVVFYPNPGGGIVDVDVPVNTSTSVTIDVYDGSGFSHFSQNFGVQPVGTSTLPVDISASPTGYYFFQVNQIPVGSYLKNQ